MKKAFTLSEALVTLAILGVLAAILIPVLDNVRPDKDKIMYKKAMYAMQSAASSAIDEISKASTNASMYWADDNVDGSQFCSQVAEALNTSGEIRCGTNSWSSLDGRTYDQNHKPDFMTTDGVMWWRLANYKFGTENKGSNAANSSVHDIIVTRKDQYNKDGTWKDSSVNPLKIQVRYDGKVGTGGSDYGRENELLEDSMNISRDHR